MKIINLFIFKEEEEKKKGVILSQKLSKITPLR
jgi:hypothetical protein